MHRIKLLGTTGKKESSGDIDIGMEEVATKEDLINKLTVWCNNNEAEAAAYIKKSGINVHFRTPIGGSSDRGFVQTDFMFVPNLEFAKFAMAADPHSKYRDMYKHITLSSLAKPLNMLWNPTTGLSDRATKKVISTDPDKIAQTLLGPNADRTAITSVESILRALKNDPNKDAKLADARATLAKDGIEI